MNVKKPMASMQPDLLVTHEDATEKINDRIQKGKELLNTKLSTGSDFENLKESHDKWNNFNKELLKRIFSTPAIEKEYSQPVGGSYLMNQSWPYWAEEEFKEIKRNVARLEAIVEKLELIPSRASNPVGKINQGSVKSIKNSNVFIVHGHDEASKHDVARFLQRVKLNPIILHEQANEGKTIIEKFEHHSDVSYAIALLTPDDSAFSKKSAETVNDRARQNVIFELGYFLGKLGRKNVCALIKSKVEIPSDYQGIVYIDYDEKNAWKFQIAKELRSAGFEIDMNDLI